MAISIVIIEVKEQLVLFEARALHLYEKMMTYIVDANYDHHIL